MSAIRRPDRGAEWWVDFRWRGTRIRRRAPLQTKRGASAFELQLRKEFSEDEAHGVDPFAGPPPTFAKFSIEWFEKYVRSHNRSYSQREKTSALKHHLVPAFGHLRLDEITTERIDAFVAAKVRDGYAPKSVNNLLSVLRCSLVTANEWRCLRTVPRVRWLRVPEQPYKFLTEEDLERLIAAPEPGFWRALILFVADTGVRFGEAAALHWEDVDLDSDSPSVHVCRGAAMGVIGPTKTGRSRVLPLTARVQRELRQLPRRNALVFPRRDGKVMYTEHSIDGLHRACDRAGIRRIGWHALRHTFATILSQRGVPIRNVQALLGHTTITMTSRYAHTSTSDLREWIARCWGPVAERNGHQAATIENSAAPRIAVNVIEESQLSKKPAVLAGLPAGGP